MESTSPSETKSLWSRPALRAGAIVLLTVIVYIPAMRAGFIWNDNTFLYDNPWIRADDGLHAFWCTTEPPDYFPLVSSSLWLEWRLWGMDARGYHVVNVLLHAVSSVLIWRVLVRLAVPGAYLAALIFAVHPVNVESVAWITERKNTLPMVFYALALLLYLRFERESRRRWYWLSLLTFLLALLGKTSVVMLPFVLLGCAWWQRGRIARVDVLHSVPFFILALALGLVTVWFQYNRSIGDDVVRTDGFLSRLAVAGWAVWFYLYKAIIPYRLCFVYPRWEVDTSSVVPYLPAVALVACLVIFLRYRRTWGKPLLAALGYFVITLLPVLGVLNIYFMRYSLVADHWQYISIVGIIALGVGLACHLTHTWSRLPHWLAGGAAAALVGLFSVLAWGQARIYRNEETLYLDVLAKNPSAWLAHNNLASVYHSEGRYAEAADRLYEALRLHPDYALAHFNMGNVLTAMGKTDEAIRHYEESLRLDPQAASTHIGLGTALINQGRVEEARGHFSHAAELAPGSFKAKSNLGQALAWLGKPTEAIAQFEAALRINPDAVEAHWNLAGVLAEQGRLDEAAAHFAEVVRLTPGWAEAHNNLGRALASAGKPEQAVTHYRAAIRLAPRFALAHRNLGEALADSGRLDEAAAAYGAALRIEPGDADTHCHLGDVLAHLGRIDEAVHAYRRALEINPQHTRARKGLAAVSADGEPPGAL